MVVYNGQLHGLGVLTVVLVVLADTNPGSATFITVVSYKSPNGQCGKMWMFMELLRVAG